MIHFGLFSQRPRNIETLIFLVNLVRRRRTMAKTVSPGVQALRKVVEDVNPGESKEFKWSVAIG